MVSKKAKKTSKPGPGAQTQDGILMTLKVRFEANPSRHPRLNWDDIESRLKAQPKKIRALERMEESGGEPAVVGLDPKTKEFLVMDCSVESPIGRRSTCYDRAALNSRKEHKPKTSVMDQAAELGIELLTEAEYRFLQEVMGPFDTKTSSWVKTPEAIRALGGALFCDYRYGTVFTYHNGAESYYAARGFRGVLRI